MLHGTVIAPDESQFAVSTSKFSGIATGPAAAGGDVVVIPDAFLLFNCEFVRDGDDLKLVGADGRNHTVPDYFKGDKHATLATAQGARIPAEVIDALAGGQREQYAQAGAQPGTAEAIGKVATVAGNATIVRNGVAVTVNAGDIVLKNDVLRTGGDGALGVTFNDGTTFSLSANAQMSVNEFVYQDGGANNQAVFNLVRGSISFFASQVAKTGDMKVSTPTATMGIRGTTVVVDITVNTQTGNIGQVQIKLYADANGNVGRVEVFSTTGTLLGTLTATATGFVVTPGQTQPLDAQQVSQQDAARDLALLQQLFNSTNIGNQLLQQGGPQDPQNPNPNTNGSNGSGTSQNVIVTLNQTQNDNGTTTTTITDVVINPPSGSTGSDGTPQQPTVIDTGNVPPIVETQQGDGSENIVGTPDVDIIFAGGGNDTVSGLAGDDQIFGEDGNDVLYGGQGNDVLTGGAGNDTLDGGADSDTANYASTTQGVIVNLAEGTATGGDIGTDTLIDIENVTGGSGGDLITGTAGANVLDGGGGHDQIDGGGGDDTVYGGEGNDTIFVHDNGDWSVDGGAGIDRIVLVGDVDIVDDETEMLLGEGEEPLDGDEQDDGPHASNVEIIDMNTTHANTIDIDARDLAEMNDAGVVRVLGSPGDVLNVNGGNEDWQPDGYWRLVESGVEYEDDDATPGVLFNKYEFVSYEGEDEEEVVLATVYVQQGIEINIEAEHEVPTGTVGYYEIASGNPENNLDDPIVNVGLEAIPVYALSQNELDSIGILFITNESNDHYGAEFLNAQSRIDAFVQNGGILILHDRFVEDAESVLPGGAGIDIDRLFNPGTQIEIVDDYGPIANGPGGQINDASLDGGNYSDHCHADRDTLPEGAIVLLTTNNPDEVVTFAYQYGSGWVIYSTIPLDFYLDGSGWPAGNMRIYAENLLAWAASLQNTAPETDDTAASGGEDMEIAVGLSGYDAEDDEITTFRITELPEDGNLYARDFSGLLSWLDEGDIIDVSSHTLVFVGAPDWSGVTTFEYAGIDSDGVEDQTPAQAVVTVEPVDDAPDGWGGYAYGYEDDTLVGGLAQATDIDTPSGNLVFSLWLGEDGQLQNGGALYGSVSMNADGTFQYVPNANFTGTDYFQFVVFDGNSWSTPDQIAVDIYPVNDLPETDDVTASGRAGMPIEVDLSGDDDLDSYSNGQVTSFRIDTLPENGTLYRNDHSTGFDALSVGDIVSEWDDIVFVPAAGFSGTTEFAYSAQDNDNTFDETAATATITVTPPVIATVLTDDGFDMGSIVPAIVGESILLDIGEDALDPYELGDGILLSYEGRIYAIPTTNLEIEDGENPGEPTLIGGTITGLHIIDEETGEWLLSVDGFEIDAAAMQAAIQYYDGTGGHEGGDMSQVEDLLGAQAMSITGGAGPDILGGTAFNDIIDGGGGADLIDGDDGDDLIIVRDNSAWTVSGGDGVDTLRFDGDFNLPGEGGEGGQYEDQEVTGVEIIDLGSATSNNVTIDAGSIWEMSQGLHYNFGPMRVMGGQGDSITLVPIAGEYFGTWVDEGEVGSFDDGYTGDAVFNEYAFYDANQNLITNVYIQQGLVASMGGGFNPYG